MFVDDFTQRQGELVRAALVACDRMEAHRIIEQAFQELEAMKPVTRDTNLAEVLNPRLAELLRPSIVTVGDLIERSRESLVKEFQFRYRWCDTIERSLASHGFCLRLATDF